MNATMSRNIIRFVAAPVAAAGIIGGAALGFSALANASTVAAAPTASTTDTGNATLYQTPGDVQINTQPGIAAQDAAQQQYPFCGYGDGGLLFHHRGGHL